MTAFSNFIDYIPDHRFHDRDIRLSCLSTDTRCHETFQAADGGEQGSRTNQSRRGQTHYGMTKWSSTSATPMKLTAKYSPKKDGEYVDYKEEKMQKNSEVHKFVVHKVVNQKLNMLNADYIFL